MDTERTANRDYTSEDYNPLRAFSEYFKPFSPEGFSVFLLNIRSYEKNIGELKVLLLCLKISFDVIVLTEAWLKTSDQVNDQKSSVKGIEGYNDYCTERGRNRNDGIVIYLRDCYTLDSHPREITLHEATSLKLRFYRGDEKHCLVAVYRTPKRTEISQFNTDLQTKLDGIVGERARDEGTNYWFLGDINIDLLTRNECPIQNYMAILTKFGFKSLINEPTHVPSLLKPNSKSCLDHIFYIPSNKMSSEAARVVPCFITDHYIAAAKVLFSNSNSNKPAHEWKSTCKKETVEAFEKKEIEANHLADLASQWDKLKTDLHQMIAKENLSSTPSGKQILSTWYLFQMIRP